jgi:hypothetical protein
VLSRDGSACSILRHFNLSGNELKGTVKFEVFGSGALTGIRTDGTEA